MGRAPCCEKESVKRGPWTPEEDAKLLACIAQHGTGSWRTLPKKAGLQRCGKSCRLRWTNYLRPDLKHGRFTDHEEHLIVKLHAALGSRWSLIAAQLPGRTDNDVKNYWNTRLKKKLCEMGIDPITHKPISQLLADLAGSVATPKGGQIAEAALGCFKDDMLNVLMRKRPDWQLEGCLLVPAIATNGASNANAIQSTAPPFSKSMISISAGSNKDPVIQQGLATAIQSTFPVPAVEDSTHHEEQLKERLESLAPDILLTRGLTSDDNVQLPSSNCYFEARNSTEEVINVLACMPNVSLGLHIGLQNQQQEMVASLFQQQEMQHVNFSMPSRQIHGESQVTWSPNASGSSCSSTTLADISTLEGVLSSDVPLWDFSELSSIIL